MSLRRRQVLVVSGLLLITLLGAGLRLCCLTRQSLWYDEVNGIRIASLGPGQIVAELKRDASPPLHYFLLHAWIRVFGTGELAMRGFAALFGILLVPVIGLIGASLFDWKFGLICALLVAIAPFHIRFSQEVRMYSMLALLGLSSMYWLYRALEDNAWTCWAGYTVSSALTIYTHNYGLFIVAAGVVFFASGAPRDRTRLRRFALALGLLAVLYLPWVPVLLRQVNGPAIVGWLPDAGLARLVETFSVFAGLRFDTFQPLSPVAWVGFAFWLLIFLAGLVTFSRRKRIPIPALPFGRRSILLACYLFVTLAIPMLISVFKPIYLPNRYSIAAWPGFVLIVGLGLYKLRSRIMLSLSLAVLVALSGISLYGYYVRWIRLHSDRDIAGYIDTRAGPGDLIVFMPSWIDLPIDYYLQARAEQLGFPWPSRQETEERRRALQPIPRKPEALFDAVREKVGDRGMLFLVHNRYIKWGVGDNWSKDKDRLFLLMDHGLVRTGRVVLGDVEVIVYEGPGDSRASSRE